ncbi:MAG TPA: DUF882 domain-containing protein [Geminicoccaceae bacterium]
MPGTLVAHRRATRRHVLHLLAAATACGTVLPGPARAAAPPERALEFLNIHTGERLRTVYWQNGRYLLEGLNEIDWVLRDFRTGEVKAIDTRLLDLLHTLNATLDTGEPLHVISGYRSPETNAMLAARSSGVAKNSYHIKGMAIDIRLPGCSLSAVRDCGMQLERGGVGYYPRSGFVHLDTGPVRHW